MRPLFFNSIVCLNFTYLIINSPDEGFCMSFLTLSGLKNALQYIQDNKNIIRVHKFEPKKGFIIIPKELSEDEAYNLYLIQKFEPKLIERFGEELTILSINGQELFDILSDEKYIDGLRNHIRKLGYTEPSDRQIYKLLKQQMGDYSLPESYPINVLNVSPRLEIDVTPPPVSTVEEAVKLDIIEDQPKKQKKA